MGSRENICQYLQMQEVDGSATYLGLPDMVGRNKSRVLGFLKEKMRQRVQT